MNGFPSIGSLSGIAVFHTTVTILIGASQDKMQDVTHLFPPMQMVSIHFEDPISFQADTLEVSFADIGDQILKNKQIHKGIWLQIKIDQWNRDYPGSHVQKDLGSFMIDQIKAQWPITQTTLLGSSVPINQKIKLTLKNRTLLTSDIMTLGKTIAKENGLQFQWMKGTRNYYLPTLQQWNESDLQALSKVCRSHALAFKIKAVNGKQTLIIFDEQLLEDAPPVYTIDFAKPGAGIDLEHGELTTQSQDIYSSTVLSWYDSYDAANLVAQATAPPESPSGSAEDLNHYRQAFPNKDEQAVEGD
jgi:hypothetical protein